MSLHMAAEGMCVHAQQAPLDQHSDSPGVCSGCSGCKAAVTLHIQHLTMRAPSTVITPTTHLQTFVMAAWSPDKHIRMHAHSQQQS